MSPSLLGGGYATTAYFIIVPISGPPIICPPSLGGKYGAGAYFITAPSSIIPIVPVSPFPGLVDVPFDPPEVPGPLFPPGVGVAPVPPVPGPPEPLGADPDVILFITPINSAAKSTVALLIFPN